MSSSDQLPCSECKGQCCSWAPFTTDEFERVKAKHGVPRLAKVTSMGTGIVVTKDGKGTCAYLKADGRCSIHKDRPSTCRKYGEIAAMPCMYLYPELAKGAGWTTMKRLERR